MKNKLTIYVSIMLASVIIIIEIFCNTVKLLMIQFLPLLTM